MNHKFRGNCVWLIPLLATTKDCILSYEITMGDIMLNELDLCAYVGKLYILHHS